MKIGYVLTKLSSSVSGPLFWDTVDIHVIQCSKEAGMPSKYW